MKLGIIGCGKMGGAIAKGILSNKVLPFNNIYISDIESSKTKELHRKFGICVSTNEEIAKKCNLIILAVKPQDFEGLLKAISGSLDERKHLISVMAGVTISRIESFVKTKMAITRAMPNMAAAFGESITCLSHNKAVREKAFVNKIFSSIGDVIEIEEELMDAVTAVSGSGPAYFFYMVEALIEGAMRLGIKKDKAAKLAVATLVGSGALLEGSALTPEELRERITSKRGTTEAALGILESRNFKNILIEAVSAAAKRSKELSKGA